LESLCWDARPAQDVRTKLWVTMRADKGSQNVIEGSRTKVPRFQA
jgi:hypothetical protein